MEEEVMRWINQLSLLTDPHYLGGVYIPMEEEDLEELEERLLQGNADRLTEIVDRSTEPPPSIDVTAIDAATEDATATDKGTGTEDINMKIDTATKDARAIDAEEDAAGTAEDSRPYLRPEDVKQEETAPQGVFTLNNRVGDIDNKATGNNSNKDINKGIDAALSS